MKCKYCDGTGTTNLCVNGTFLNCPHCGGTGEVEQTNEEWFSSLSTEEKATFLAIQVRLGVEFYRTDDERYQNYDWWVRWLKEKYNG